MSNNFVADPPRTSPSRADVVKVKVLFRRHPEETASP